MPAKVALKEAKQQHSRGVGGGVEQFFTGLTG
jgi:hypothetical protein